MKESFIDFAKRCRSWQKENSDWELVCNIENQDSLYIQWNELDKTERMFWVGSYREAAKDAFEEFGIKRCKVVTKNLNNKLELLDVWPVGHGMLVFKTHCEGKRII